MAKDGLGTRGVQPAASGTITVMGRSRAFSEVRVCTPTAAATALLCGHERGTLGAERRTPYGQLAVALLRYSG